MSTTMSNSSLSVTTQAQVSAGVAPALIASSPKISASASPPVGTTAGSVNAVIAQGGTVVTGTPVTINVATGLDPMGNAAAMVHVTEVAVVNNSATLGQIIVVGAGTHAVMGSDQFTIDAGDFGVICRDASGYPVTGSSADTLTLTTSSAVAIPYQVIIKGRTA